MFRRIAIFVIVCVLCCATASAETLSHFMFRTVQSWNVVDGEVCLLPVVTATKIGPKRYQMDIKITERGEAGGRIDKIMIHVFDDVYSSEDEMRDSEISGQEIGEKETIELSEVLEVEEGQWVGYEFFVGETSFLGSCQCAGYGKNMAEEDIPEVIEKKVVAEADGPMEEVEEDEPKAEATEDAEEVKEQPPEEIDNIDQENTEAGE